MDISELHSPVMVSRCLELLAPSLDRDGAVLVDCTLGLGGHTEAFLSAFPKLRVVGLDRDPNALKLAGERLAQYSDRIYLVHTVYDDILDALEELDLSGADGVLLDLGVSSMQLDQAERGFAYSYNAPLDMRMDNSTGRTAADVINEYDEAQLARIFKDFGEERYSRQIARKIVQSRSVQKFVTSSQLAELIASVVPFIPGKSTGHPAKRVFQALRIEVNAELEVLQRTMPRAIEALKVGGRIVVLAYHSLEDRIVKQALAQASSSSAPVDLPIELPEHAPTLRLLVKGAEQATESEIQQNPRAASVRLRAAEKIRQAA